MVVLRHVRLTRKRAKMAILKYMPRLHLQNPALILIGLAFPLAFPNDWSAFAPVRDSSRTEHVLCDLCGIDERSPYVGDRGIDCNLCFRNECVIHSSSNKVYPIPQVLPHNHGSRQNL